MRYTLRQLEVFLATAHFENVTKAADSLAMSQSAASGALKDLEQQFNFQLFDRIGKRLRVNDQGRNLRQKAEALMEQARELEMEMINPQSIGDLNLGATLTIGNYLAVDLVAEFMRQSPGAKVNMVVANTASIAMQVLNFDLDVGLVEGELVNSDLDVSHWRNDELVVFCSPNHPYAAKQSLADADLLAAEWILRETGSGTRQGFDRAMHGLLSSLWVKLELQHTEAIKRAVESGLGISCLSRISLEKAFERGDLVPLPVPHRDLHRAFYFILRKDKFRSAAIKRWLALCREQ
ncbi:Transcriptional regulator [marine gamma proteobacterium HTCC2143]|jgi:DNA-binding transcriptional LysR family regulator|uniref:Transcriptional regulator n=1 Tax=marine gamma proteobacterium HTCC2143 TaxID=247633 RepID=A0Y936_9GAMM|nr:Transcriptional regulator [marine gamma proteobacterium HTCC2143]